MTAVVKYLVALMLLAAPLGSAAVWADHHGGADSEQATQAKKVSPSGPVSLNTASAEELQMLPNIGEKRAQAILDYRQENGEFKAIEDVKNVPGIGDKTFDSLKKFLKL